MAWRVEPAIMVSMSLVTRFTVLWSLLTAGLVVLFGFLSYRGSREHLLSTWRETLLHDADTIVLRVRSTVEEAARDAVYLANTPTVTEFVRTHADPSAREQWRRLIEADFRALLGGKGSYFQVRLIGLADGGRELVRLDNTGGRIEVSPSDRLQQKANRDYFQAGLKLGPGEVSLSDIDLNQDFGKITEPHTPTLRAVAPVMAASGERFGMIVINEDMGRLLAALQAETSPGVGLQLANQRGDFLIHADPAALFGTDLGRPPRFASGLPEDAATDLRYERRFAAATGASPEWQLRVTARETDFLSGLADARNHAMRFTGLAALGGMAVVFLSGRWLSHRLRAVTNAMARYEAGQDISPLPEQRSDEIGLLAAKFHEMAGKVREDVTKLEAARHEAEEATRARDDFLAMMSHEIRTPMNAVIGLLRVLERNRPAPHQAPILASLRTASRQLVALLNEALDHSKIKAGKIEFQAADFSLRELLSDVALTHRPLAAQKGLAFDLQLDSELPHGLHGDPVRLAQVLNNLVSNAIKFTNRGFVRLAARPVAPESHSSHSSHSSPSSSSPLAEPATPTAAPPLWIEFTVTDSGIGVAEENIGRIFAPFDQEHGEIGRRFGGTGLGLSIVRSLVELQGGTLAVESRKDEGSCFRVRLPFDPARAAGGGLAEDGEEAPQLTGCRLLYVEDIASNQEVMAATLAETGATLVCAETGAAGLEALRRNTFDLGLIDLQLPDMTGLELSRAIQSTHPGLRLIAVTAQVSSEVRDECLAAGLSSVVAKPFTPGTLWREIVHCLPADKVGGPPVAAGSSVSAWPSPNFPADSPATALAALFPREPERVLRLLRTLADEFQHHEHDFVAAAAARDQSALRALRHRLHSALAQLRLDPLKTALDRAVANPADDATCEEVVHHLRSTAASLSTAAGLALS